MKHRTSSSLHGAALFVAFSTATAGPINTSSTHAQQAIAESTSAVLQGDVRLALRSLSAVDAKEFVGVDMQYRSCMLDRFSRPSPPATEIDDPLVRGTLSAYQAYWHDALLNPAERNDFARELKKRISESANVDPQAEWDVVEQALSTKLRERGFYSQLGYTPPLRELMIWRTQGTEIYEVELPDGPYKVPVYKLDDFVTFGWSSYARCGRGSNGGWADEKRIYAVMPAFKDNLGDDTFRASLLAHEAQHFADKQRFTTLEDWELEYRAKLAELWTARERLPKLLNNFRSSQSDDKNSPHTYANKRVMAALRDHLRAKGHLSSDAALGDIPPDALRRAAHDELLEDSKKRRRRNAPGSV
jgi:hypothetical protein